MSNKDNSIFREINPGQLYDKITLLENEKKLLEEERNKAVRSNIVNSIKEICSTFLILTLVGAGVAGIAYAIKCCTKDNTSGQHARNVSTWTARNYMRAQYPNQQYNIYCRPSSNTESCYDSYQSCYITLPTKRFYICCDSDEINSNNGCIGSEVAINPIIPMQTINNTNTR